MVNAKKIISFIKKSGVIIAGIVAVVGIVSNYLWPSLQFLGYILQSLAVIIMLEIINHFQRQTIVSATDEALSKIENSYKNFHSNSNNLFKIFQLNDGGNFYNIAHNIFFYNLIESYSRNGENRIYYIPIDTYYKIIMEFLRKGYKLKTINGLLLPFWYAQKERDEALLVYTNFSQENAELYKRVTYYQDYKDNSWRDDTVRMIYKDLLSSEKGDDVAVRWLITLIAKITELKDTFGKKIDEILHVKLDSNTNYFQLHNSEIDSAIRNNMETVTDFLKKPYKNDKAFTNSQKMTDIINTKFYNDMGKKNKFVRKSDIDSKFYDKFDRLDFEDVTEIGYYYKEKDDKTEYDQFVMFLNGSNTGPSIEIEIITDEEKVNKIQMILSELTKEM